MKSENILFFDVETSIHNKGNPFDERNFLVSYAYFTNSISDFQYYTDPSFIDILGTRIRDCSEIIGFNIKFDLHWAANQHITLRPDQKVWDCQLAEFVYSGQEARYASLNETLEKYGLPTKMDAIKEYWDNGISTEDIPINILKEYNEWDVMVTKLLYETQQKLLNEKQKALVWLLGEDLKALQAVEYAGIKFDVDGARKRASDGQRIVEDIERSIYHYLPDGIPDNGFNLNSGDHLSALLYGGNITFKYAEEEEAVYKSGGNKGQPYTKRRWYAVEIPFKQRFKPLEGTEVKKTADDPEATTRFFQVDSPTLSQLKTRNKEDKNLLELLAKRAKENKVVEMLNSLIAKAEEMHWKDNYIHGQFNQNVVITGRLSSSGPNLQNQPPEIDEFLVSRYDS